MTDDPSTLTATEAAHRIGAGSLKSEALVGACLDRIRTLEPAVQAWQHLDPELALSQARAADLAHAEGRWLGPLHGVPVGIKDIIDTAELPCEYGTPVAAGRRPNEDAAVVAQLRAAGAVIMGKTVTTELAAFHPGKTRNPHDPERTPGGSSSGSAAAVASHMVPLAVGSQTNGSVIRPASFCGAVGFKPSFGRISRHGMLPQVRSCDHVGVFAGTVEDAALLVDCISGYDARDPDMRPSWGGGLAGTAGTEPPVEPTLAFVKGPFWDRAEPDAAAGFAELAGALGERVDSVELPEPFGEALALHNTLVVASFARSFDGFYSRGRDQLSARMRGMIEEGRTVTAVAFNRALDLREVLNAGLDRIFERYDAIVTPSAPGQAPKGMPTGDPSFCTLWTYLGTPAVSLPLLKGADGVPVGVQLVGRRGDDGRLLRTARWLIRRLSETA